MEKNIKLVMSDIDGTILDDKHVVDSNLKESLKLLKDQDVPFVLASARSPRGMYPIVEELEITDNPIACYNGALVLKNAKLDDYTPILSHELNKDEVRILIDITKHEFPHLSINLYSGRDWYVDKYDKWAKIEASITNEQPIVKNLQLLMLQTVLPLHKLLLIGSPEEIVLLQKYWPNLQLKTSSFYLSKENYLEVTHCDVSKEKALMELTDYYKVPLEKTMTIGDNFNDIPMLSLAGIGISMANAPEEVQKSADVKIRGNNENGVSEALKKYVINV
ncbi:Cof-type HAD-IIB family hydrolase [Lederbergia sp. NSJ-179]|uniref:Cof-type HAD-IIB family hydrolase n=1 Tax=Lederbergia sp. NSJ-179 TaxID=2931402 RepID=UPI001FD47694|nr:Cof-type HAD-IIB family hydrolase [Lederbergia sp. NSJ-179]MCJ7841888.1 Cof-type HAD-IIB family hydrolase [Lederbergia sp. NSJ-179]